MLVSTGVQTLMLDVPDGESTITTDWLPGLLEGECSRSSRQIEMGSAWRETEPGVEASGDGE